MFFYISAYSRKYPSHILSCSDTINIKLKFLSCKRIKYKAGYEAVGLAVVVLTQGCFKPWFVEALDF